MLKMVRHRCNMPAWVTVCMCKRVTSVKHTLSAMQQARVFRWDLNEGRLVGWGWGRPRVHAG